MIHYEYLFGKCDVIHSVHYWIEIAYRALRRGLLRGKRAGDRPAVRRVAVRPGTHRLRAALVPSAGDQDQ